MAVGGVVYYLHGDHLGSTVLTTDGEGQRVGEVRYAPYGATRWAWGNPSTAYRYTGQRWEGGVGLYDYRARWYEPTLGRFVQPDTLVPEPENPQDLNRYTYVRNNPLKYTDPTGYCPRCVKKTVGASDRDEAWRNEHGWNLDCDSADFLAYAQKWFKIYSTPEIEAQLWVQDIMDVDNIPFRVVAAEYYAREVLDILWVPTLSLALPEHIGNLAELRASGTFLGFTAKPGPKARTKIYRSASGTPDSLTPRPGIDDVPGGGLSFFDDVDHPGIKRGKVVEVDSDLLKSLQVIHDNDPPGHVTVRPYTHEELVAWAATRGTGEIHPFTQELLNAVTNWTFDNKRQ